MTIYSLDVLLFHKEKLYRQEKDSDILSLAYDIRNGELNKSILNKNSDLTFIECSNEEVMSLLLNMLSRLVITFLPRSHHPQ